MSEKVLLWRCQNQKCSSDAHGRCIFDFELPASSLPKCPRCGLSHKDYPEIVIRRKVLHYDPPHAIIEGRGVRKAACDPNLKWVGTEWVGYTGSPADVTCPDCRKTEVWIKNAVERHVIAEYDRPVQIDPAAGTITGMT